MKYTNSQIKNLSASIITLLSDGKNKEAESLMLLLNSILEDGELIPD